jgi:HlyD family secretion protein
MKRRFEWAAMLVIAIGVSGGLYWWRYGRVDALPPFLARGNGRLEMTRIDIAVKYPGRIVDLPIQEGELVRAGAILARQDTAEVQTQILGAEAQRQRALSAIARAEAELDVRRESQRLAHLEWSQTATMRGKALVSQVELERRKIGVDAGTAGVAAATGGVNEARNALAEADAQIARLKVILGEATIRAPISGRIEYRIVEKDAVLPAGGRIASLLESDNVYMTVFLPSGVAGKIKIGDEARITLDAFGGPALPAKISFVAAEAQFTPKYVETASEREKLVYRVKLQIPVDVARRYAGALKAGMTGNGYVRTDAAGAWPERFASWPDAGQVQ